MIKTPLILVTTSCFIQIKNILFSHITYYNCIIVSISNDNKGFDPNQAAHKNKIQNYHLTLIDLMLQSLRIRNMITRLCFLLVFTKFYHLNALPRNQRKRIKLFHCKAFFDIALAFVPVLVWEVFHLIVKTK